MYSCRCCRAGRRGRARASRSAADAARKPAPAAGRSVCSCRCCRAGRRGRARASRSAADTARKPAPAAGRSVCSCRCWRAGRRGRARASRSAADAARKPAPATGRSVYSCRCCRAGRRGRAPVVRPGSGPRPEAGAGSPGAAAWSRGWNCRGTGPSGSTYPGRARPGPMRSRATGPQRRHHGPPRDRDRSRCRSPVSAGALGNPASRTALRPPCRRRRTTAAGTGVEGWRRDVLPCSCTPRFLVPGPFSCAGRCRSPGPGADSVVRARIPARTERHPRMVCDRGRSSVRARHSTACQGANGNQSTTPGHLPGTSPYPAVILSGRLRS